MPTPRFRRCSGLGGRYPILRRRVICSVSIHGLSTALLVPLGVMITATLGLALLVEPFVSWYFQWAWWSYVFIVDALARRLGAPSLMRGRVREFLLLCSVSIVLWTL